LWREPETSRNKCADLVGSTLLTVAERVKDGALDRIDRRNRDGYLSSSADLGLVAGALGASPGSVSNSVAQSRHLALTFTAVCRRMRNRLVHLSPYPNSPWDHAVRQEGSSHHSNRQFDLPYARPDDVTAVLYCRSPNRRA
jgi:hypothetical protein